MYNIYMNIYIYIYIYLFTSFFIYISSNHIVTIGQRTHIPNLYSKLHIHV